jgi:hypothetical protein
MGAFSADGILSSAFGIVNEKDDNFLWTVDANGKRHFDIGSAGGPCHQHRVGRAARPCQRFGQVRDEVAGRQNDKVSFGQERGFERLALVEQDDGAGVGNACRTAGQPEFDGGIGFADGGEFRREMFRTDRVHEDLSHGALAKEVGQFGGEIHCDTGNDSPADGSQFGGELGLIIGDWLLVIDWASDFGFAELLITELPLTDFRFPHHFRNDFAAGRGKSLL